METVVTCLLYIIGGFVGVVVLYAQFLLLYFAFMFDTYGKCVRSSKRGMRTLKKRLVDYIRTQHPEVYNDAHTEKLTNNLIREYYDEIPHEVLMRAIKEVELPNNRCVKRARRMLEDVAADNNGTLPNMERFKYGRFILNDIQGQLRYELFEYSAPRV